MIAHPAAYLRRSYVDPDSPGDISREAQRAAVRKLAATDGHNGNLIEYDDWGISADVAKASKRTAYARLLADMEAGKVAAVYAFDIDRLYRDPRDLLRLQDAALSHDVKIITTAGELAIREDADPINEAMTWIGAAMARAELRKAKKRNRAARDARIARGDDMGQPAYGLRNERQVDGRIKHVPDPSRPVAPLVEAVREAGSILGAVKLLNVRRIPAPKGGKWHTSALTRIVERHAPELLPRRGPTGRRVPVTALLSQVLRCHCGQTMTPNVKRGQYYCYQGQRAGVATHGRAHVREVDLMPWVMNEAARLRVPERVQLAEQNAARRAELGADRESLGWAVADRHLSREQAKVRADKIEAELQQMAAAEDIVDVPQAIDWTWEPQAINEVLRALWHDVRLDADMKPIEAIWRVPAWRA